MALYRWREGAGCGAGCGGGPGTDGPVTTSKSKFERCM